MKTRYLVSEMNQDLKDKIVLLAGPRQVGKTTLAKVLGETNSPFAYFNWDYQPDRKKITNYQFPGDGNLLIFDELHKYKHWKNYIKGVYDRFKGTFKFLVTGSAKLDIYRKGGDSLTGRYHYYVLHPFSLPEILGKKIKVQPFDKLIFFEDQKNPVVLNRLWRFGPFPEPYLKQDAIFWRRWQAERVDRLIKEEIRDLRMIGNLSDLQILADLLPNKVGSLLSINSLREDLEVAHKTAVNYLDVLEMFYFHFRIYPYTAKKLRSLKKMAKLYLWDWSIVENEGARFENMVASHLLKLADYLKNTQGFKTQLFYLRDSEGREVDFLLTIDNKPWFAVEAKINEEKSSSWLEYFDQRLKIPFLYQVIKQPGVDYYLKKIRVLSADKFLSGLV